MNKKLLTDEALRDDLYAQLMFTAGAMGFYGINGSKVKDIIEKQLDQLVPVVKKHIKRHVKVAKESTNA